MLTSPSRDYKHFFGWRNVSGMQLTCWTLSPYYNTLTMNIAASKSLRPNKAQLNAGPNLKVQQLAIPELKRLQQQELQAQQLLTINKPVKQIPRQSAKPTAKPKQKPAANRLEAPYKKPSANPAPQPKSRTVTFGNTTLELPRDQHKLAALKDEALEYWKNLPDIR